MKLIINAFCDLYFIIPTKIEVNVCYPAWPRFIVSNRSEHCDKSVNIIAKQNTVIELFGLLAIYGGILSSFQ